MRPSAAIQSHRDAIHFTASRFGVSNLRIFGSVLRDEDGEGSDLDFLVDAQPGVTLLDLGGLQDELEHLLGVHVDVVTAKDLPLQFRDAVLADAKPL